MGEIPKGESVKKNFDFVDSIRCISMMGIVFEHATVLAWHNYPTLWETIMQDTVIQLLKFVTISFFLIAGFLINHKFTEYSPIQYIKNRFKKTIGPWAFWLHILILADLFTVWYKYHKHHSQTLFEFGFLHFITGEYYSILFTTSFWFILNFLICICLLLMFRRYIYSLVFGAVLGLISLFYCVNVYYSWIPPSHTTALFGFVFYLWLGAYMNRHYMAVTTFIRETSIGWFGFALVFTFAIATLEIIHLQQLGRPDAFNTLRASNIAYSLVCFAMLLKIGRLNIINRIFDPRNTTFGIYLIHQIIIFHLIVQIFKPFHLDVSAMSVYEAILYSVLRFIITYGLSILMVKFILKTRFRWSIGG